MKYKSWEAEIRPNIEIFLFKMSQELAEEWRIQSLEERPHNLEEQNSDSFAILLGFL